MVLVMKILMDNVSFPDYITQCRQSIETRRLDLSDERKSLIIDANSPFELHPRIKKRCGALLIHGLLDSPFTLADLGHALSAEDILCKAVLLPGHGTRPDDLMAVAFQDWIETVRYGINQLKKEAEKIYLVGYSTGAALSVYHAMNDPNIAGVILLAPAIRVKAPVDLVVGFHRLIKWHNRNPWIYQEEENDYTKYRSVPFNAVHQVSSLTDVLSELQQQRPLQCPIFMAMSREDETISSHSALDFFCNTHHPKSKLLLYTSFDHRYPDKRIITRETRYPDLQIKHFSHICIPFAVKNPHYGLGGDYHFAPRQDDKTFIYGAYNPIEVRFLNYLHRFGLIKHQRQTLSFNPDFKQMAENIVEFIFENSLPQQISSYANLKRKQSR